MKTFVPVLFLAVFSFTVSAQNNKFAYKSTVENYISQQLKNDTTNSFAISPKFKEGIPWQDSLLLPIPKKDAPFLLEDKSAKAQLKNQGYELRMPVVGGGFSMEMPTYIPDSTVTYYILQKQIDYFNPLEKKRK